ncbi:phosphotransferase [Maribacter sp. 2308TA10-17]|uniref:phosphotransferase n=1 Tax=Maribacter sp. 2308TA10-17 TaxID=3386276 RepID=UPI0039BD3A83
MSQYSILNKNDIDEICRQYGIGNITSFLILNGGSENTNYQITTQDERYVLTICEQKTVQSARELAYLLEYLAENKFETSKLIRTIINEPISNWKGKPVMFKVFLNGEIIQDIPNSILEAIGEEIGQLHKIEAPDYLPKVLTYGKEYFHEAHAYAADSNFEKWLREIEDYIKPYFSEDLPKSLIHSDIFFSNIVVNTAENDVCIMDFEEAANYFRIFDIGMTLVGLCCNEGALNLSKATHLLRGYQKELALNASEKSSLQAFTVYAAAAMTFWRHRNFNHVNPEPEMFDHYLGLKVIADSVKNMPVSDFLKILN